MDVKEKIQQFLDYKGININQFEISIGVSKSYWRKTKSISANIVLDISRIYTDLNLEWLFRSNGEMLVGSKNTIIPSNSISYNNKGNVGGSVGVGNTVNVTLPESGTQKIIKPSGEVEISTVESSFKELDELKKENSYLKEKISHLTDNMQLKDDLIASLRDTIELLRHRQ